MRNSCFALLVLFLMSSVHAQSLPLLLEHDMTKVISDSRLFDLGDVDGDGSDDIGIVAISASNQQRVTIVSGRTGQLIHEIVPWLSVSLALPHTFVKAPDIDGDGRADFGLLSVSGHISLFHLFQVFSGATGNSLAPAIPLGPASPTFAQNNRPLVKNVRDMTGDGMRDWVVSRVNYLHQTATNGFITTSSIHILDGATNGTTNLVQYLGLELTPGGLAEIGDVNGDGVPDIAASSGSTSIIFPDGGSATVYSGANGQIIHNWFGNSGDKRGSKLVRLSDLDGNGALEIALFSPGSDAGGTDAGRVEVFSTTSGLRLIDILPAAGEKIVGLLESGDHDGDGKLDFMVDIETTSNATLRREVRSGANGSFIATVAANAQSVGDLNGDNIADFIAYATHIPAPGQTRFIGATLLGAQPYGSSPGAPAFDWLPGTSAPANGAMRLSGAPPLTAIIGIVSFAPANTVVPGTTFPLFVSAAPSDLYGTFNYTTDALGQHTDFVNLAQPGLAGIHAYVQYGVLGANPITTNAIELLFGPL